MTHRSPDEEARRRHFEAVSEGRFADALSILLTDLHRQLLFVLARAGYEVEFEKKPETALELIGGLAAALQQVADTEGEERGYVISIGQELTESTFGLQHLISRERSKEGISHDELAQLILQAIAVGARAEHLGLTISGHFDEYIELKLKSEELRRARRAGAAATNAKKQGPRSKAFDDARERCIRNPRLSNEDLAIKAKDALDLPTSIRTMTGWMRDWRRAGKLPPIER